jgi:hypothetical protein
MVQILPNRWLFTFGSFLKITEVVHIFGLLFSHGSGYALILTKMYWATFWAIFPQTYLYIWSRCKLLYLTSLIVTWVFFVFYSRLPDGIFSYLTPNFGILWPWNGKFWYLFVQFGIICSHLLYFILIWYMCGSYFFPILVYGIKKIWQPWLCVFILNKCAFIKLDVKVIG